ncbi:MAG: hypothetical protein NTX11_03600 [Candidatus Saccharibacteria bacterium]|nr:hypothetical protein [Candidatus Saccharibacteria bacterium]
MPPQDTVQQTPQPAQPNQPVQPDTPPQPAQQNSDNNLLKKIKNAGQSTLVFGCFMVVISLIVLLGIKSVPEDTKIKALAYFGIQAIASFFWIVSGLLIKKASSSSDAIAKINQVVVSIVVVLVSSIAIKLLTPSSGGLGLGVILTLILGVYILFIRSQIKKLSSH